MPVAETALITNKVLLGTKRTDYEKRLPLLQQQLSIEAQDVGGKNVGLKRLETLADEIGFGLADTEYLTISEGFEKYVEANKEAIALGDAIIEHYDELVQLMSRVVHKYNARIWMPEKMMDDPEVVAYFNVLGNRALEEHFKDWEISGNVEGTISTALMKLSLKFVMPQELKDIVNRKISAVGATKKLILRTSGRFEDGFSENLAGEYKTLESNNADAINDMNKLYQEFIRTNWQALRKKVAGDGCAVAIQPYLMLDSGFIGFSSLYGITTIEVVLGGVENAMGINFGRLEYMDDGRREGRQSFGSENSIVFDIEGDEINYTQTFSGHPKFIKYHGSMVDYFGTSKFWKEHTKSITLPDGRQLQSPMTLNEIKEVNRVLLALEERLGYPVDVEGGFVNGKLYLVQVRPVIGLAYEERTAFPKVDSKQVGRQCLSIGPIDFTGHLVYFSQERVPNDVAAKVGAIGDCVLACKEAAMCLRQKNIKVLIDMENGSRLEHDTQQFYPVIKKEKRCYVAGLPIEYDLRDLEYDTKNGLLISRQKVRVVSDGLRARVYIVTEVKADVASSNAMPRGVTPPTSESERIHTTNLQDTITYIQAQPQAKPLIVAVGTSWIKGYEEGRYLQHDAINPLLSNLRNCREFERAQFVIADDKSLAAAIQAKMGEKGFEGARVIALAGEETINKDLAALDNGKNVFMGVDSTYLTVDSYIRLMEMLKIASKLAINPDIPPDSPNIPIERRGKFWVFIPRAEPMNYETLKAIYEVQKFA